MKIKVRRKSYEEVLAIPPFPHKTPGRQSPFLRALVKTLSAGALKKVRFSYETAPEAEALLRSDIPCLVLMNHSCFTDLEIAGTILAKKPYHIICTVDGFVGKDGLLRSLGCVPTKKFTTDPVLVRDMVHVVKELKESILMYPEASYTFDGTATPLPESLGKLVRLLGVPVLMIETFGAFVHDPLYNNLQVRDVTVTAKVRVLVSAEETGYSAAGAKSSQEGPVGEKSRPEGNAGSRPVGAPELNRRIKEAFTFDGFRWQQENHVRIAEDFRADDLQRVLYKCPHCLTEGRMLGNGTKLLCTACGEEYELDEYGFLKRIREGSKAAGTDGSRKPGKGGAASAGSGAGTRDDITFTHVPDWYAWERSEVRREITEGSYRLSYPVRILALRDTSAVYEIGEGVLTHTPEGFHLTGCGGALDYRQAPEASYSLYADYFWYEIGDMICVGDSTIQFYCFPMTGGNTGSEGSSADGGADSGSAGRAAGGSAIVAKARLAAEEMYKLGRK